MNVRVYVCQVCVEVAASCDLIRVVEPRGAMYAMIGIEVESLDESIQVYLCLYIWIFVYLYICVFVYLNTYNTGECSVFPS